MADSNEFRLIGRNFTPPDLRAKVTGEAKYAEDFRMEGMAFIKMLLSPMPHCRVSGIDASAALEMEGVYDVLTADEVPSFPQPQAQILNNAPNFAGEPILAIAAVDESAAAAALELVQVEYEPLPFTIDPLESLYPDGPNANVGGNLITAGAGEGQGGGNLTEHKWTARDFAAVEEGQLPTGRPFIEWQYGDIDGAFENAALVLDETFVTASNSHHSMEPRSCLSYWQNGKCFVHGSTQSQSFIMPALAGFIDISPDELVYVSEFCGGGFGSKAGAYALMALPAHFSRKIGRPCMLRVTRAEEYYLGSARASFQGRVRLGFSAAGKITAADLYIVQQNGAKEGFFDYRGAGQAKALGLDRLEIRRINAPGHDALVGSNRQKVSSAYAREAMEQCAQRFDWRSKMARSGERNGSKVIGLGVGQAYHPAGSSGFDGLVRITPDGKLHIHTGVGNLGTYSYATTSRVAAEVLGMDWSNCVIERGDSRKHLPFNLGQFGSNTSHTMSRTNYAAAMDAKQKLQEIAAMDLGGEPQDYELANETVYNTQDGSLSMTFAQAAQRAIELGGKFSGEEMADDLLPLTRPAVAGIAGSGLVGAANDNIPQPNHVASFCAALAMIELDVETGQYEILEFASSSDCGTVVYPMGLHTQIRGGAVMGIGMARSERVVYDPQNGLPANVGLYQAKPASYLDLPSIMEVAGVDQPDPDIPMGMKGMGEPPTGAAASALLSAVSDALGGHYFNRNPVTPDMIVNAVSGQEQSHSPLAIHTQ